MIETEKFWVVLDLVTIYSMYCKIYAIQFLKNPSMYTKNMGLRKITRIVVVITSSFLKITNFQQANLFQKFINQPKI